MTNIIQLDVRPHAPMAVIEREAHKAVREEYWGIEDYDVFTGWMSQFIRNAEDLTYSSWCSIVSSYNVQRIK